MAKLPWPFLNPAFSLSLLSYYGLVLSGRGLRADRVLIALSQHCIANLIIIIIIIIIIITTIIKVDKEKSMPVTC